MRWGWETTPPPLSGEATAPTEHCRRYLALPLECTEDKGWSLYLAGLQTAGDAVLVGFTAAIGQAPITAVLLCAGDTDITTAIRQQVLPLADIA